MKQAAVQGIVVIYDIGGVTTSHTLMMTPAIMKKHVVVFQVGATKDGGYKSLFFMFRLVSGCLPDGQHGIDRNVFHALHQHAQNSKFD